MPNSAIAGMVVHRGTILDEDIAEDKTRGCE